MGGFAPSFSRLRAGPSSADEILDVLTEGDSVTLSGGIANGFYLPGYRR